MFFSRKKTKSDSEKRIPGLSPAVTQSILGSVGSRSIPAMPGAAHRAFQLATDPSAEARDFIDVIEADEALAGRVLKIANSVFYDRGRKSTTIEDCVLIIGMEELRGLLNANTLSDIFPSRHPARAMLWANDIATALIARTLAVKLLPSKTSAAFLGGLMHDVGKLLLLQRATEDYQKVLQLVESQGIPFPEAEEQVFPFDHTEAGQLIAEQWRFPPELTEIIRGHHGAIDLSVSEAEKGGPSLNALIQLADLLAHALGLGHQTGMTRFRRMTEEKLPQTFSLLGIIEGDQKSFLASLKRQFELEYDLYAGTFGR